MSDKDVATRMELDQSIAHALYDHGVFHEGVMPEKVRAIIREELAKSSCSRCKRLVDALQDAELLLQAIERSAKLILEWQRKVGNPGTLPLPGTSMYDRKAERIRSVLREAGKKESDK